MTIKIYIIAGEPSGDFIAGRFVKALKNRITKDSLTISLRGIGGENLKNEGIDVLFDCQEIAVMGLFEVIPHVFKLRKRIQQTIQDILDFKPDVVLTVDAPGFCYRVIDGVRKKLKKNPVLPRFIHYVAPSVWAWRPKRALHLAKRIDHLLCLFPFEPAFFEPHGLLTNHVGHPLVELDWAPSKIPSAEIPTLCLLPGSRSSELRHHLDLFRNVINQIQPIHLVIPTFKRFEQSIRDFFPSATILTDPFEKRKAMIASTYAIAASGTVTLELALARTPCLIVYRTSKLTAFIIKKMIHIPWVGLSNILMQDKYVPELLQEDCNAQKVVESFKDFMKSNRQNYHFFDQIHQKLSPSDTPSSTQTPSEKAVDIILRYCQK